MVKIRSTIDGLTLFLVGSFVAIIALVFLIILGIVCAGIDVYREGKHIWSENKSGRWGKR